MTWYSLNPTGAITLGNLTPVGQNSGQVGCRWPPNGHHLAACVNLPSNAQIWGPFWHLKDKLYVVLPQIAYTTDVNSDKLPQNIYCLQWDDSLKIWQKQPPHQNQEIKIIGNTYLIEINQLKNLLTRQKLEFSSNTTDLQSLPWETITLSHNSREDYQVKDEGGFFAEMTTLLGVNWSIAIKIIGDYTPPEWGCLGAGGTPVKINPLPPRRAERWDFLGENQANTTGGVLLTAALWQKQHHKTSIPYPPLAIKGYAADLGIPWQSWKKVAHRDFPEDNSKKVQVLTPGEWVTPAGAVYLWEKTSNLTQSGPLRDPYNRHVLGYGHLWLF